MIKCAYVDQCEEWRSYNQGDWATIYCTFSDKLSQTFTSFSFQDSIAGVIESDMLKKVHNSPYISTDESTDISNSKKMVVYARVIDPISFVASTHFLWNITIEGSSATAEELYDHIVKFLKDKDIPLTKVSGFGSDNASFMVWRTSGVATRLR